MAKAKANMVKEKPELSMSIVEPVIIVRVNQIYVTPIYTNSKNATPIYSLLHVARLDDFAKQIRRVRDGAFQKALDKAGFTTTESKNAADKWLMP